MIVTLLRSTSGSNGGRTLAREVGANVASLNSRLSTRQKRLVINWGVAGNPHWTQREILFSNSPTSVARCSNKINTLIALSHNDVPCLEFGTRAPDVMTWLEEDGKVVCRHTVSGHSGAGIEIIRRGARIPEAPLYTRYFKKQAEYRVHVAFGRVILVQQKKRRNGYDSTDPLDDLVRVHDRGWIFATNNLSCDAGNYRTQIEDLALRAIGAVGAQHGAVDILVSHTNRRNSRAINFGQAVVCEINSAPAIEATSTRNAYSTAFRNWIEANAD